MKAVVATFNQEKALVGVFSVIVKSLGPLDNLRFKVYWWYSNLGSTWFVWIPILLINFSQNKFAKNWNQVTSFKLDSKKNSYLIKFHFLLWDCDCEVSNFTHLVQRCCPLPFSFHSVLFNIVNGKSQGSPILISLLRWIHIIWWRCFFCHLLV